MIGRTFGITRLVSNLLFVERDIVTRCDLGRGSRAEPFLGAGRFGVAVADTISHHDHNGRRGVVIVFAGFKRRSGAHVFVVVLFAVVVVVVFAGDRGLLLCRLDALGELFVQLADHIRAGLERGSGGRFESFLGLNRVFSLPSQGTL